MTIHHKKKAQFYFPHTQTNQQTHSDMKNHTKRPTCPWRWRTSTSWSGCTRRGDGEGAETGDPSRIHTRHGSGGPLAQRSWHESRGGESFQQHAWKKVPAPQNGDATSTNKKEDVSRLGGGGKGQARTRAQPQKKEKNGSGETYGSSKKYNMPDVIMEMASMGQKLSTKLTT